MVTVGELLRACENLPAESARRDTEILLSHCLEKPRTWLYTWPDKTVPEDCVRRFRELMSRRAEGHPVAYLTGVREFWSLSLAVNSATLIPRPETETLVAWALALSQESALPEDARVLDLGTGSGAIALAIASEKPSWRVAGVDASEEALEIARENARRNGLEHVSMALSHWYEAVRGQRFDLLLANPPYIDSSDKHLAQGDVRFEPRTALVSAQGGLADLGLLSAQAPAHLRDGGWLLLEHGFEQGEAVRDMLSGAGFTDVLTRRDLAGHERVTGGRWHAH